MATNLIDVNLDCFLVILKDADIWDLLSIAKTNRQMKFYAEEAFKLHRRSIVIDAVCKKPIRERFEVIQYFGHLATSISIDGADDFADAYYIEKILALLGSDESNLERLEILNFNINMNVLKPVEQLSVYKIMCQLKGLKLSGCNLGNCGLIFHFAKSTLETIECSDCLMDTSTKNYFVQRYPNVKTVVLEDGYGAVSKVEILEFCGLNRSVENWTILGTFLPVIQLMAAEMLATKSLTLKVFQVDNLLPLAALPALKKLTLIGGGNSRVNVAAFLRALSHHGDLQELELRHVTFREFPEMPMPNNSFRNLKSLRVTAFNLHPFQRMLHTLVSLERIQLNGSSFSLVNLHDMFATLPNLRMGHVNIVNTPGYCTITPPYKTMLEICRSHAARQTNLVIVMSRGFGDSTMKVRSFRNTVLIYPAESDAVADVPFEFGTDDEFERARAIGYNRLNVTIKRTP